MVKKTINTPVISSEKDITKQQKKVSSLAEQIIFTPSTPQAKVKAKFWTRFQPGPLADPENITMTLALEITNSAALRKWWSQDGFQEWFLNKEEEKERLKYLFNKGLDTMEDILDNPDANANAKANIIKMLAEMNGYLGKKPVEKFADEEFNRMSEAQLKSYLERKGVTVTQEQILDVGTSDKKEDDTIRDEKA